MDNEKIVSKLEKLIRKRDSAAQIGNQAEAEAFAKKVTELLLLHNLEESEINTDTNKDNTSHIKLDPEVEQEMGWSKNEANWTSVLLNGIAQYNMCKLVKLNRGSKLPPGYTIIGAKVNQETVIYLWEQLVPRIRAMAKQRWSEVRNTTHEKRNTFLRGYYLGCCAALITRIREMNQQVQDENPGLTALIRTNDQQLAKYAEKLFGQLGQSRRRGTKGAHGASFGRRDGKSMNINKGVSGGGGSSRLLN